MRTFEQISADARPGAAFSNSGQFEYWASGPRGCHSCRNDNEQTERYCPILSVAMCNGTTPAEWITFSDEDEIHGSYTCTEYDGRSDGDDDPGPEPGPPPVIEGQVDMFEVFADRIADQASAQTIQRETAS